MGKYILKWKKKRNDNEWTARFGSYLLVAGEASFVLWLLAPVDRWEEEEELLADHRNLSDGRKEAEALLKRMVKAMPKDSQLPISWEKP